MVNITITPDMTKEMVIAAAHEATAVPALYSLYAVFGIVLALVGLGFKGEDTGWGRFFWIWSATMLLVGLFLLFFVYSPGAIQWVATKWTWAFGL